MVRLLRPGGKLVITDLDSHTFTFLREEQHDRWMGFERADVQQWFEQAGLREVRVDCAGSNCCADSACGSQRAECEHFSGVWDQVDCSCSVKVIRRRVPGIRGKTGQNAPAIPRGQ
jgi:hypothetical protein